MLENFEIGNLITTMIVALIVGIIIYLKMDTTVLDIVSTKITAIDITIAVSIFTVTANAEHIPNTCKVIGLFCINGSFRTCRDLLSNSGITLLTPLLPFGKKNRIFLNHSLKIHLDLLLSW